MAQLYGNIEGKDLLTFDKTFSRANGQPLDNTTIWYSLEQAQNYAASEKAYVGQIITVVDENITTHYSIINTDGVLEEVGKTLQWVDWGN